METEIRVITSGAACVDSKRFKRYDNVHLKFPILRVPTFIFTVVPYQPPLCL